MCRPTKKYLVLDCETAHLPLEDYVEMSDLQKADKTLLDKIGQGKPLIYDLGWLICDRNGEVYKREKHIIPEVYYNEHLFNTAYYREKRPLYEKDILSGKFAITPFQIALEKLIADLQTVVYAGAYNAMFDFKKALPFTQKYLKNRNSQFYYNVQKESIYRQLNKEKSNYKNPNYTKAVYEVNGYTFPIIDIWVEACEKLINCNKYKEWCIENGKTGKQYFTTNAETVYQYITGNTDFIESHTALEDCEIEKDILIKCINRKAIDYKEQLKAFPFQALGTVKKYLGEG